MTGKNLHRAALLVLLLALVSPWAAAGTPTDERGLAAWVEQRVRDWQPTPEERRFDEIGWARDIRDALRLARQHNRPVFLFTYDGTDMAIFRC
jgi:hypothetical protein